MSTPLTPPTTIEQLRREAKRWLRALRADAAEAVGRFEHALPGHGAPATLRDVQHALARELGFPGWLALTLRLGQEQALPRYQRVADALVVAYSTGEAAALGIVWDYFGHQRAWGAMRRYVRLDLGRAEVPAPGEADELSRDDARLLVARAQGFATWDALARYAASRRGRKTGNAVKAVRAFSGRGEVPASAQFRSRDWDEVIATIEERRLTDLDAQGQMTDSLLERFSLLESLTDLSVAGSAGVTDAGLRHLTRMPQLERLDLSGCPVSDAGLAVLRELPALRWFTAAGGPVTDAGMGHLAGCPRLERVDLGGTRTGDGAIRALAGKAHLADFRSGEAVTNAGLVLLGALPTFREWRGGEPRMELLGYDAGPNYLSLRGSFTDAGCAALRDLHGLYALNVDSSRLAITGASLSHLRDLPHFSWLGFDARDESMPAIAALPHLQFLMCQDTAASDRGWMALATSASIEYLWGRRCYGLAREGFLALSRMPSLKAMAVSCRNVDDAALAALPAFPALEELMPMDIPDAGYRHIGRCSGLQSLVLMYCRDTGDEATGHLVSLPRLRRYFVSYNRITDRTPELLAGIDSLEDVTIDTCPGVTDRGVAALARLPRLRRVRVSGMPRVTGAVAAAFGSGVEVSHDL